MRKLEAGPPKPPVPPVAEYFLLEYSDWPSDFFDKLVYVC